MSIIGTIHEDVITDVLGYIGQWQWIVTVLSTCITITSIFNQYEDMYLLKPPQYIKCISAKQYEVDIINSNTECSYTAITNVTQVIKCDKWLVKFLWFFWMKKSWFIYCDIDSITKLLSTTLICRLGLVLGCVLFGFIGDSFGRRLPIMINTGAEIVFRLSLTFCDSEIWFRLFVFLRSIFTSANYYLQIVLVSEISSNVWRTKMNFIVSSPRMLAAAFVIPFANVTCNHETFNFMAFLLNIFLLITLKWIPESPMWLLYNRKIPKAEKMILKAAKTNHIELCSDFKIRPVDHRAYNSLEEDWNCLTILTTFNIRVIVLVSLLIWMFHYSLWTYLHIKVYSQNNKYMLLQVISCSLFIGLLSFGLGKKLKLRHVLLFNMLVLGFSIAVTVFLETDQNSKTLMELLASIGWASGLVANSLLINITPRMYAVNTRASIYGCCHAFGHIGAIVCYLIISLTPKNDVAYEVTAVVVTLMLAMLCLLLPDIDGRELPDTMKDVDYFSELSKPLRWISQKTNSPSYEEMEMRVYSFGSAGQNVLPNASQEYFPARHVGLRRLPGFSLFNRLYRNWF